MTAKPRAYLDTTRSSLSVKPGHKAVPPPTCRGEARVRGQNAFASLSAPAPLAGVGAKEGAAGVLVTNRRSTPASGVGAGRERLPPSGDEPALHPGERGRGRKRCGIP